MTLSYEQSLEPYIEAVLGMKAFDVVILDVRGISSFADTFIICSGRSHRQVSAIAESVQRQLKGKGVKPLGVEGKREGHWILMDYGDVIIHVFYEPIRTFYDLENLWADARRIEIEENAAN
ncbi:MAG: ribosome silencing factor [Deltaproteobacteria bacterium]|nr:ribosome silencing factor [Deltaproteobacteria bacterium]